jgi:pimeloyl-ACP methyl ester carboxylesterase
MKYLFLFLLLSCSHKYLAGYAPVNKLKLYYEIHGQGEPLILIHGGGGTIDSDFGQLIPYLKENYLVIAIEEQGHGHTQTIDREFSFEQTADDVAALLAYLRIEKAHVLGFSNGGTSAMRLTQRHPLKVNKLIIASSAFRRDGMVPGFWDGMKNATLADMPEELKAADRKINPDPSHLEALFLQDTKRMLSFRDWSDDEIKKLNHLSLVIVGDQDTVRTEHALQLAKLLPHGRLLVLPSGHGEYLNKDHWPHALSLTIAEFLK